MQRSSAEKRAAQASDDGWAFDMVLLHVDALGRCTIFGHL
jgi:hypothetical protein